MEQQKDVSNFGDRAQAFHDRAQHTAYGDRLELGRLPARPRGSRSDIGRRYGFCTARPATYIVSCDLPLGSSCHYDELNHYTHWV